MRPTSRLHNAGFNRRSIYAPAPTSQAGLATDVYLPVLLELGDPGEQAVGFEIQFLYNLSGKWSSTSGHNPADPA